MPPARLLIGDVRGGTGPAKAWGAGIRGLPVDQRIFPRASTATLPTTRSPSTIQA
jgi:hypothetical protein